MSDGFRFWTHGVSVIPEYTKEYDPNIDNNLRIKREGYGAIVSQKRGSGNWFHFAIPSATELDDDRSSKWDAWLKVYVNNFAVITAVNIHEAKTPSSNRYSASPRIYSTGLNKTGVAETMHFNIKNSRCVGPLVMSVHVRFDQDYGKVIFYGAGAHFEEAT